MSSLLHISSASPPARLELLINKLISCRGSPWFLLLCQLPIVIGIGLHIWYLFSGPVPPEDHLVNSGDSDNREAANLVLGIFNLSVISKGAKSEINSPRHLLQTVVAVEGHFLGLQLLVHRVIARSVSR